jgi:hypothetical protein
MQVVVAETTPDPYLDLIEDCVMRIRHEDRGLRLVGHFAGAVE